MTRDALVLLGRDTSRSRETLSTHARRLREREVVDEVRALHYGHEPRRDLRSGLAAVDDVADRVFAVPMVTAHARETVVDVPAALDRLDAAVRYCEPVGRSSAVTAALSERADQATTGGTPDALGLVALGSSSRPYHRQVTRYHASRLRDEGPYEEVETAYLVQNPAAECLRYNVAADRAVVVPLFVVGGEATERDIPDRIELDRAGLEYADPLGEHPRVTDAVEGELVRQRAFTDDGRRTFEDALTADATAVATDGQGR